MPVRDSLLASIAPLAPGEVLVVADDATRAAVHHHLGILALTTCHADSAERARALAAEKADTLDCVVVDTATTAFDAFDLVARLREDSATAAIPILVVLGKPPTEAEMLKLIEAGVMDHLAKPINGALLCAKVKVVSERSRAQRELNNKLRFALENAALDPLTGLFNRRYFERRLREESKHVKRHRHAFSVILIDLDHFKLVNDTYGHAEGDRVLMHVAEVLNEQLREDDVACRYGGEEIIVLLRETEAAAARVVANRLRAALAARPIALGARGETRQITFSAGVAAADERHDFEAGDLVARADRALYRAKNGGRNRVEMD